MTPIGQIPSTSNMVSTMFVTPVSTGMKVTANVTDLQANGDNLPADTTFTMELAVQGMVLGMGHLDRLAQTPLMSRFIRQRAEELLRCTTTSRRIRVSRTLSTSTGL